MERRTGKIRGTFSRMHRALDGWMLVIAPRLHQLTASTTMTSVFQFFLFCTMCGLEKLGIVDQTGWNVVVRFVAENPGNFSQQTLLGALIVTGRSASCFGE